MNAKGHIAVGRTTGMAIGAVISVHDGIVPTIGAIALGGLFSLLTSQLPDIDSPTSKISKKIPIVKIISDLKLTVFLQGLAIMSVLAFLSTGAVVNSVAFNFMAVICGVAGVQIIIKSLLKHRRFTHTLLANGALSAIFLYPYFTILPYKLYLYIAMGMVSGLIAHLAYDTATVKGCPLLYPFVKKNISPLKFLNLQSGKYDPYGVVFSYAVFVAAVVWRILP